MVNNAMSTNAHEDTSTKELGGIQQTLQEAIAGTCGFSQTWLAFNRENSHCSSTSESDGILSVCIKEITPGNATVKMFNLLNCKPFGGTALCICLALSLIFNLAMIMMPTLHDKSCPGTFKAEAAGDGPRNVLEPDGFVSNCVTGKIIGKVSANLRSSSILDATITGVDTDDDRRTFFKELFDNKVVYSNGSNFNLPITSDSPLHYSLKIMAQLHVVIDQLKMRYGMSRVRLLDIPCGDMLWMSQFLSTRDDIDYTGIDIVPDIIASHRKLFVTRTTWKFHVVDIIEDGVGEWSTADGGDGHYDLVLCRNMIVNLKFSDSLAVLKRLSDIRSGVADRPSYLMMSTHSHTSRNTEKDGPKLKSGKHFRLNTHNLLIPPFSLVPPLCLGRDTGVPQLVVYMGVWPLPLRQVADCTRENTVKSLDISGISRKLYSCSDFS